MALTPIHAEDHLQPGSIGTKPQVKTPDAGSSPKAKNHMGLQRSPFQQLDLIGKLNRQRLTPIISSKIPGIPELTAIGKTPQFAGGGELIPAEAVANLQQPPAGHINLD